MIANAKRAVILIIDDAIQNIQAVAALLGDDYELRFATSAEEGLAMAAAEPGPELILLDVVMPGMDGFTACARLKEDPRTRFVPVVIMTALGAVEDRVRGIEAGADDFLTKPIDARELLARVRTALRAKRHLDERLLATRAAAEVETRRQRSRVRACPRCFAIYPMAAQACATDGTALESFDEAPLVGRKLDRYNILSRLGEGGMGVVYLASHATLADQRYAIKVLHGHLATDATLVARFRREAESCARLDHPNVVAMLDYGTTAEQLTWLVMEYVPGQQLSELIAREAPLSFERIAPIVRQLAAGLAHLHAHGLVHRDVKPQNILISRVDGADRVKLLDFGLVGLLDAPEAARLTRQDSVMGTPLYMAPEQHQTSRVGPASDLYSLGATLHEMLTRRAPFEAVADRVEALFEAKLQGLGPSGATASGLEKLSRSLLAPRPEDRPASAAAVVAALDQMILERTPPKAKAPALPAPLPRPSALKRRWSWVAAALALAVGLAWLSAHR